MQKLVKERMNSLGLSDSIPQPFFPLDSEIIEIGAVKLDDEFKTVDRFQARVCPVRLPILNPYVAKAIDITQEEMDSGSSFPNVINQFYAWCRDSSSPMDAFSNKEALKDDDIYLLAWSNSDNKAMKKNLRYYGLQDSIPFRTINVQKLFADYMGISEMLSLKKACIYLDIHETRKYHHAEDDAYYTAKIFQYLLAPLIDTVQKENGSHISFDNRSLSLLGKKSLHELLREHKSFSYPKEKLQVHKTSSTGTPNSKVSLAGVKNETGSEKNVENFKFSNDSNLSSEGLIKSAQNKEIKDNLSLDDEALGHKKDLVPSSHKADSTSEPNVEVFEINDNLFVHEFSAKPRAKKSTCDNEINETVVTRKSRNASFAENKQTSETNLAKNDDTDSNSSGLKSRLVSFFKKFANLAENKDEEQASSEASLKTQGFSKSKLTKKDKLADVNLHIERKIHASNEDLSSEQLNANLSRAKSCDCGSQDNPNKQEIIDKEELTDKLQTQTTSESSSLSTNNANNQAENISLENKIEKQLLSKVRKIRKSDMLSDTDLKRILYHISQDSNLRRKSKYYFSKNLSDYNAFGLAKSMTFTCPSCNQKLFTTTPMQLISFGHLHGQVTCPLHGKFNLSLTINSYLIRKQRNKRYRTLKQKMFDLSTIALERNEVISTKAIIVDDYKIQKECQNLLVNQLKFNNPSSIRDHSKIKDLAGSKLEELDKPNRKKRFIIYRDSSDFDYKKKQNISYMTKEDMRKGRAELAFSGTFTLNKAEE